MSRPGIVRRNELELFMECEEEELAPSQRQATVQAQKEYKTALQRIVNAKTTRVPRSVPPRKVPTSSSQVPARAKKRDASDVIVIDDDPSAVVPVFPAAKQGRPPTATRTSAVPTKSHGANFFAPSYPSLLRSASSSATSLIASSSNMSPLQATQRLPAGMILPANMTPYLTLPTTIQPTSFGAPGGKRVLLAVPVSAMANKDFVMSKSTKQLHAVNLTASAAGVPRARSGVSLANDKTLRGRTRKILGPPPRTDGEYDEGDDVRIVEPFQMIGPGRTSHRNPVKSLAAQMTASGTRNTGHKRTTETAQSTAERQAELAPKKPKLANPIAPHRRPGSRSEDSLNHSQANALQISTRLGNRRKPEKDFTEEEESYSTWIPLDEYYYGKKEGDPSYREEKGEYRFKCWYCHKLLYNNLRLMLHMQGHIDSDRLQNLDLSDLTQCKHCYSQFDTPFELQCHIEKVHQSNSNVLVCRICEKDHDSQVVLCQHMKNFHSTCEMPYTCNLCNYRSSIYNDVVDHFKKRHNCSQYVLCLYCLKTFKISFHKSVGWGMTHNFYQHMQKHQNKSNNKKCICCKLTFLTKQETDHHRARDHLPNYRGTQSGSSSKSTINGDKEQVLICLKETSVKSLGAPPASKPFEMRALQFNGVYSKHVCLECKKPMNSSYHYKNYVECTLCRFATSCSDTFSTHVMKRHSGVGSAKKAVTRKEEKMTKRMFCLCGFSSTNGALLANHLVSCSKRTCYSSRRAARYFDYDLEQEGSTSFEPCVEESEILRQEASSPDADVPSLFGALGLVKKQRRHFCQRSRTSGPRSRPQVSSEVIVRGIIEDSLDILFPAEAASSYALSFLLEQVARAVRATVERPSKKFTSVKISPSTKAVCASAVTAVDSLTSIKISPDCQVADDLPVIDPVKLEEDEEQSKVEVGSPKEFADIFWNTPDHEKTEAAVERGELPEIQTPKAETRNELESTGKQNVDVADVKLENQEENQEENQDDSDVLEVMTQLSTDGASFDISDDFLITMDDENAEDDDEQRRNAENADHNATARDQSSSNLVTNENYESPVLMTAGDDVNNTKANANRDSRDEKEIADSGEIIQNNYVSDECREISDRLRCEPYSDNSNFFESIRKDDCIGLAVVHEQNERDAVGIYDADDLETVYRSGYDDDDDGSSSNRNNCDLETEKMNYVAVDFFTDELNVGNCEDICNRGLSDWDCSNQVPTQSTLDEYGTKQVEFTDDNIIQKVSIDQQSVDGQPTAGQGDAGHDMGGSVLEKANFYDDQAGNEAPGIQDISHGSCDRNADYEVYAKDKKKFKHDSMFTAADVLQPVGSFRGNDATEIDTGGMTSSTSPNLEDRGVLYSDRKDVEIGFNSRSSEAVCADDVTRISKFINETGNRPIDRSTSREIPALVDAAAKEAHRQETKAKGQELLDSLELRRRLQPESLGAGRKESHSAWNHGLPTSSSSLSDSHKSDSSCYKDHGYTGRDERRDNRNYEQRGPGQRDCDRRDCDRRDYDQRYYDQRYYDQRDFDRRNFDQRDNGSRNYRHGDRGESNGGHKNESHGHTYRHERDDRHDRDDRNDRHDHFSRRDRYRNTDSNGYRNNSSSHQRNYYY